MNLATDQIDALFAEWDKPNSPGCALGIIKDGELVYARGYGMADLEHAVPITSKSVFDIGSTSKQFTALCAVLLARQGKLSLDDPVRQYIPELPAYEHPVTIRHLVHHTSGIRDYLELMDLSGLRFENEYPDDEVIGLIAGQQALNFAPGEAHLYSNSGYLLLAEIVKRVSGMSLRAYADQWIFAPLGMVNTHFHDDFKEIVKNRAVGYAPKGEDGFEIDMSIFDVVGDGAVYTTVEDLLLWDRNYYQNTIGGYGEALIAEITTPGVLNSGELLEYAFGLEISEYRGLKMVSHGGSWAGYRSDLLRFPDQGFSVICLANLGTFDSTALAQKVVDLCLADLLAAPSEEMPLADEFTPVELPEGVYAALTGFYRHLKIGAIWELTCEAGGLFGTAFGMRFQLIPSSETQFRADGIPFEVGVVFAALGDGDAPQMQVHVNRGAPEPYAKLPPYEIREEDLPAFPGTYYSAELDIPYRINLAAGGLVLSRRGAPDQALKPVGADLFTNGFYSFLFTRDAAGKAAGFLLGAGRVQDLRFVRQPDGK